LLDAFENDKKNIDKLSFNYQEKQAMKQHQMFLTESSMLQAVSKISWLKDTRK